MTKKAILLFVGLSMAASLLIAGPKPQSGETREIKMTAKKYQFDPKEITVKQGEKVRLIITATDRDHGFKLDEYGINQKLQKGVPATIEFTADKPGTFTFRCSEFCGLGHPRMKGNLIVEKTP
ncbi:MAG TPA: cupredoxin domain-containing protein [Terriglobia bacterium]|nr:cupredoxin domain-containing protein [Terriglobia bacterium]